MATQFLEPGGDADFQATSINGFWGSFSGTPAVVTDFVHGSHLKSIQFPPGTLNRLINPAGQVADAGGRFSCYIYFVAFPAAGSVNFIGICTSAANNRYVLRVTSAGVLQLFDNTTQLGSDGATLSLNKWYRISFAWIVTSTTVNEFRVFVNGVLSISVTNATVGATGGTRFIIGNLNNNPNLDFRSSDHYIDDSTSLTDTGNIWVTAKRPNANGTTNGFTTGIGSDGAYGSGHALRENERPLNTANGWSMIGAGAAVTEEYNIESAGVGDIDIRGATIIDWLGWVSISSLVGETVQIILDGASNAQAITSTTTLYTKIAGSTTYPSGTGADIGVITDTSLTTVSLYECGIIVAYIPRPFSPFPSHYRGL